MIGSTPVTGYLIRGTKSATELFVGVRAGTTTPTVWRPTTAQVQAAVPASAGLVYFGDARAPAVATFSYEALAAADRPPMPGYRLELEGVDWFVSESSGAVMALDAAGRDEFVAE